MGVEKVRAEDIADGLTKAQREFLSGLPKAERELDRRSVPPLLRLGVIKNTLLPNHYMPAWKLPGWAATELGLAVRDVLTSRKETNRG